MSDIQEDEKPIDKIFKINEKQSSVKTEIVAGLTTFMSMAYIIALNPNILSTYKYDNDEKLWNGIFLATCLSSAIAMFVMGFFANLPFCLAPGMGLNSFMATVILHVVNDTNLTYREAFRTLLIIILIEGIIFFILSIFNIRKKIVECIPLGIRLGITPGIGLMLLNIGFGSNIYIANSEFKQFFVMKDFFGSLNADYAQDDMGDAYKKMVISVITIFIGLFLIIILSYHKIKGSVIIGMLIGSAFYWACDGIFLDENPFKPLKDQSFLPPFKDMFKTTFFRFNFKGLDDVGWFTVITLIITFCIIDMFDTIGTLVGTADRAGMVDENGEMPNMKEAFISDSIGTIVGACTGTSTVTTFIESASGVEAGGRSGLTAIVCGLCFLFCIFLSPIAAIIPAPATSSALIYVGILMMSSLSKIDFEDISICAPVTIMLIAMPISGSIGHAIGLALITFTIIKMCTLKFNEVPIATYVISLIFLIKFFLVY